MNEILTSSSQCIVVESRLADFKGAPLVSINLGIRINNIKILILQSHQYLSSQGTQSNSPSTVDEHSRQPEQPNVASDPDTY